MSEQEFTIREGIQHVVDGGLLSQAQAAAIMDQIMTGQTTGAQIGALVTALRMRGETVDEIAGFASAMRRHALKVHLDPDGGPVVDTCGTGGDAAGTFNISTTASFVIAAAGVRVAKHGNRAMTSKCGSADLLEELGVTIELSPEQVADCIDSVGIGFMFAQAFHPAMRYVGPTRREIGIRTIFNVLGPLTNPAGASHQLIGVGHPGISGKLAEVLGRLGSRKAVLVHADEGLDELGLAGISQITEWDDLVGEVRTYTITPEEVGLQRASLEDLQGGDRKENAWITRSILNGDRGPRRDAVVLNAGAGLYAANAASSIAVGVKTAADVINSGEALEALNRLVAYTRSITPQEMNA